MRGGERNSRKFVKYMDELRMSDLREYFNKGF